MYCTNRYEYRNSPVRDDLLIFNVYSAPREIDHFAPRLTEQAGDRL